MQTHKIKVGNTLTPIGVTFKQKDANGTLVAVDLTDLTVKFQMVSSTGAAIVAETETGFTVTDAVNGKGRYDFQAGDVTTAGEFFGQFNVYSGNEYDSYPVEHRGLRILILPAE